MRIRLLGLCVVLLGAALGAAGCSSSGTPAPGVSSNAPGASSGGPGASSSGKAPVGKPGGTVTVRSGNKVVCVITLDKNGTGTCKVSTANYTPGKVTFTGTYNGGSGFKSGSGTTTLTVKPASQTS
jgi:hypothetical protein